MAGGGPGHHGPTLTERLILTTFWLGVLVVILWAAGSWLFNRCERHGWGWCEVVYEAPQPQRGFRGTMPANPSGPTARTSRIEQPSRPPPGMPRDATASRPYRQGNQKYWYEKPCKTPGVNPHDNSPMCFD